MALIQGFHSKTSTPLSCAAAHSSREESRCSQRQQKALNSTVLRLSENLKQLQQENAALREELNTDSPAAGMKGTQQDVITPPPHLGITFRQGLALCFLLQCFVFVFFCLT